MIGGATRGRGGRGLAIHLADSRQSGRRNDATLPGASRGLVSDGIEAQIAELTAVVAHSRGARPLYHAHADPPEGRDWDDAAWDRYWDAFEHEFGLTKQPFAEAHHFKRDGDAGRWHRHRVYSLVKPSGACIRMDHDHARREKLHRMVELEDGQAITAGAHNKAVVAALEREGRHDLAAKLVEAGITEGPRPRAGLTPEERAQQVRTDVRKEDVRAAAWRAWQMSDSGPAFAAALEAEGFRAAMGDEVPVLVDRTGNTHPLARAVAAGAKAEGAKVMHGDVHARLKGVALARAPDIDFAAADFTLEDMPAPPETRPEIISGGRPEERLAVDPSVLDDHQEPTATTEEHHAEPAAPAEPAAADAAQAGTDAGTDKDPGRRRDLQGGARGPREHGHHHRPVDGRARGRPDAPRSHPGDAGAGRPRAKAAMGRAGIHRCQAVRLNAKIWARPSGWLTVLCAKASTRPVAEDVRKYVAGLKRELARLDSIIRKPAPSWRTYHNAPDRLEAVRRESEWMDRLHDLLQPPEEEEFGWFGLKRIIRNIKIRHAQEQLSVAVETKTKIEEAATKAFQKEEAAHAVAVHVASSDHSKISRVVGAVDDGLPRTTLAIKAGLGFDEVLAAAGRDVEEEAGRRKIEQEIAEKLRRELELAAMAERAKRPVPERTPANEPGWEPPKPW